MKRFAVFDIDGTLYRWQLYHELVEVLALENTFPHGAYDDIQEKWDAWRSGDLSFGEYEKSVVHTLLDNLPNVPTDVFEKACDTVVVRSVHKTHAFPRNLLKKLKKQGYFVIAITGTQQELIERFGRHYGFDAVVGAIYERRDGRFTGNMERMTIGRKPEILRELVEKHGLSWQDSVAIGDSDGDIDLLDIVEKPTAFNPSEGLFKHAKQAGWPIVIERKNIAYKLEKKGHELVLAETIVY